MRDAAVSSHLLALLCDVYAWHAAASARGAHGRGAQGAAAQAARARIQPCAVSSAGPFITTCAHMLIKPQWPAVSDILR